MDIPKLKKNDIKSLECMKFNIDEVTQTCQNLTIGSIIKNEYIPYYCKVKQKRVWYPGGSRKCKQFTNTKK